MNVLSSTNRPSLSPSPSADNSPTSTHQSTEPISQSKNNQSHSPMTISMSLNKARPLDLSSTDRTNSADVSLPECSKFIKVEEGVEDHEKQSRSDNSKSVLGAEKYAESEKCLKSEIGDKFCSQDKDKLNSEQVGVSTQLKAIAEIFKTLNSSSTSIDPKLASNLQAILGEKSGKDESSINESSLMEAIHQLGWKLINLGRGNSTPSIPVLSSGSLWQQSPPNLTSVPPSLQSSSAQQSTSMLHPPMSGISMRGNQKYSAFYQHNRKHQVMEDSETFRQSTAVPTAGSQQFHRLGFPPRRINGPPLPNHGRSHFPNPSGSLEAPLKPTALGQRMQSEMSTPTRSRETAFLCSCGEDFESLYVFTLHMRDTGHKPRSSQPERDIPKLVRGQDMWINSETEQTREILRCMRCNQSFRSLPELTMHMMKTSHYSEIVYSDAGRNLQASQTFSSVVERNRGNSSWNPTLKNSSTTSSSASSSMSLKRSVRGSSSSGAMPPQNGTASSSEPPKPAEVASTEKRLNGHPDTLHRFPQKSPRLEELPKRERPASSHEMHTMKPSPKPAASPEAMSCPSEIQRSTASSPRNENDRGEPKYLNSPTSSRENTSPRASEDDHTRKPCTDSVIRQIESFVEKSLPFSSASSTAAPRAQSWQHRQHQVLVKPPTFPRGNLSPLTETDTSRSTPDKGIPRKRRYSSGSSNSMAPTGIASGNASLAAAAEKRSNLSGFTDELGASENPLSSLQKLVETTHQTGSGLKSPSRPFSQSSEISPVPSNHSNDMEFSEADKNKASSGDAAQQQTNIAAALSALQNFMSKVSGASACQQSSQTQPGGLDFLLPTNGERDSANLMELLSAVLSVAKQSEAESKLSNLPSPTKMFEQPTAVFPGAGFDFNTVAKSQPLVVHMNPPTMTSTGPTMVANITKKAKCHFCGKPFANKGQVRLHISKNKCPCLLQQSAMGKPSTGPGSSGGMGPQGGDKRGLSFPYPGFPSGAPDLSRFFSPQPPSHRSQQHAPQATQPQSHFTNQPSAGQTKSFDSKTQSETAALAAVLRQFNAHQSSGSASLTRSMESNPGNSANNPLFSFLFPTASSAPPPPPPPPPPQNQALETSGLTPEQKAFFLFAQAILSLGMASSNKPGEDPSQIQMPQPPPQPPLPTYPPLMNLLQGLNTSPPMQDAGITPEALGSYLNMIRQLASLGNMAAAAAANLNSQAVTTTGTSGNTPTLTPSTNSLAVGESTIVTSSKDAE